MYTRSLAMNETNVRVSGARSGRFVTVDDDGGSERVEGWGQVKVLSSRRCVRCQSPL